MLTVITGSMFAGKTSRLLEVYDKYTRAKFNVGVYYPSVDTRTEEHHITSRNGLKVVGKKFDNILDLYYATENVILIDEINLIPEHQVQHIDTILRQLISQGKQIFCFGLNLRSDGQPFLPTKELLARADHIEKLYAVCNDCGDLEATMTHRLVDNSEAILIGDDESYEPLCRKCWMEKRGLI